MVKKVVAVAAATGGLVPAGAGLAVADSSVQGAAVGNAGILSGNVIQAPVNIPLSVCGNSISIVALLNPASGNTCVSR